MKRALLAWGLCILCLLLTLAGSLLYWESLGHGQIPHLYPNAVVIAAVFPVVGALIAVRQPRNPIGWLFCGMGLSQAGATFLVYYAAYTLLVKPGVLPGGEIAAWLAIWSWQPGFALLPLLLLLFPNGRLLSPRWRWVVWCVVGGALLGTVNSAVLNWSLRGPYIVLHADDDAPTGGIARLAELVVMVGFLCSVVGLMLRFWWARGIERQQLKWFSFAAGLAAFFEVGIIFTTSNSGDPNQQLLRFALLTLQTISLAGVGVALGIAILRYRLYEIDVIIRRTLVYTSVSVTLALLYWGGIIVFQQLFRWFTGAHQELAVMASTLAIAALFTPLRRRVQDWIDQRFYRRKYDAEQVLAAFGEIVRNETDLDQLTATLVEVVQETLQPEQVALWLTPTATAQHSSRAPKE
ncbi:MAG: hypothetical protein U0350_06545 [Caldilineaceae bacterium]